MQLTINGDLLTIPNDIQTVSKLLNHLKIDQKSAIVERNENILQKNTYDDEPIEDGDRIEIVHFVGGG